MKVLLFYPRWTIQYGSISHFAKKAGVYPPLNLAYIAALAEREGHEAKIVDGEVEKLDNQVLTEIAVDYKPDIIGVTASSPFFHFASDLASLLKVRIPDVPIMIGGPHITVRKERDFLDVFDFAFIGEADISFPMFLGRYEKKQDISNVKGILYRDNGVVKYTGNSEPAIDVDAFPLPARHLLKMNQYKIGTMDGVKVFSPIMTVRGCPFKCIFCSTEVFGSNIRKRSPIHVVEEIKHIKETYGTDHFIFLDDTLTLDKKHLLDICDLIIKERLFITFEGSTRANLIDEEIIAKMSKAGLIRLSFGLESVDEKIRKIMRKEVPLESYIVANKLTNKYDIETLNSCMIGLPGETKYTIKKTLSFLRDTKEIKQANLSIAVPYPGTALYDMAVKGEHGLELINNDFSKFIRYNSAVMKVGNLTPEDLINLQNDAFASIYLPVWRWMPVLKKSGFIGLMLTFIRLLKSIAHGRLDMILVNKNYWKKSIEFNVDKKTTS